MKRGKKSASKTAQTVAAVALVLNGAKFYKVLSADGESQNGGKLKWSLPNGEKPGEWHEVEDPCMCSRGLHLTSQPTEWWKPGCRVFEVEAEGLVMRGGDVRRDGDKVVARKVRLLRELSTDELVGVGIIRKGEHTVEGDRRVIVEGSAKVTAYDSAKVTAYDSAQVTASGSAQVTAYDSAKVTAYDSAKVTAYDSAQVTAYDSAKVTAYYSAKVTASGSAQVTAYDSAQVTAYDSALVGTWPGRWASNLATVELKGFATHVDYRAGGRPTVHLGDGS